jgi:ribose 5-phosphate isomerase A
MKNPLNNSAGKKFVATLAARLVQDGMVAGVGTGSTIVFLIEELARRTREEGLKFVAVPTSFQSRILCLDLGIAVRDMQDTASLDLAIDGADEVDGALNLIKGGGASHTREKIVAAMAKEFVVVVDESKLVDRLGSTFAIPIEVLPSARSYVERAIRDLGGDPVLRIGVRKDGPVVTDNGELIFDVRFAPTADLRAVDEAMHHIPGIIETGLFFGMANKVLVGCGGAGNLSLKTLRTGHRED